MLARVPPYVVRGVMCTVIGDIDAVFVDMPRIIGTAGAFPVGRNPIVTGSKPADLYL